jgi:single-strand DNA-binding protein
MASINKVILMGNLTRDPELRYTPGGIAVANLGLATNRVYKDKNGEKKEEATFVRVVVWGRQAEVCGQYLTKGSGLFVEGRLQSRSWETEDKQKRSTLEVVATNIQFVGGRKEGSAPRGMAEAPVDAAGSPSEEIPPMAGDSDEDIPF